MGSQLIPQRKPQSRSSSFPPICITALRRRRRRRRWLGMDARKRKGNLKQGKFWRVPDCKIHRLGSLTATEAAAATSRPGTIQLPQEPFNQSAGAEMLWIASRIPDFRPVRGRWMIRDDGGWPGSWQGSSTIEHAFINDNIQAKPQSFLTGFYLVLPYLRLSSCCCC